MMICIIIQIRIVIITLRVRLHQLMIMTITMSMMTTMIMVTVTIVSTKTMTTIIQAVFDDSIDHIEDLGIMTQSTQTFMHTMPMTHSMTHFSPDHQSTLV